MEGPAASARSRGRPPFRWRFRPRAPRAIGHLPVYGSVPALPDTSPFPAFPKGDHAPANAHRHAIQFPDGQYLEDSQSLHIYYRKLQCIALISSDSLQSRSPRAYCRASRGSSASHASLEAHRPSSSEQTARSYRVRWISERPEVSILADLQADLLTASCHLATLVYR